MWRSGNTLFPTTVSPAAWRRGGVGASASGVDLLPVSDFGQEDDWEDFTTEFAVLYTPPDYELGWRTRWGHGGGDGRHLLPVQHGAHVVRCESAAGVEVDATDRSGVATLSPVPYDDLGGSDVLMRQVDESRSVRDADTADDVAARKLVGMTT